MIEKIGYIGSVKSEDGKVSTIIINTGGEDYKINLTFPIPDSEIRDYIKESISNGEPSKIKIINKNGKLKKSKMFIDKKAYIGLCKSFGIKLEDHMKRINTPEETDLDKKILSTLTRRITRIIK